MEASKLGNVYSTKKFTGLASAVLYNRGREWAHRDSEWSIGEAVAQLNTDLGAFCPALILLGSWISSQKPPTQQAQSQSDQSHHRH